MFPLTITLHNDQQLTAVLAALRPAPSPFPQIHGASSTACDDQLKPESQEAAAAPVEKPASAATPARTPRTAKAEEAAAPASTAAAPSPAAASAATDAQASTAATDVAYADLQKLILKLHAKDPTATQAIAAAMGLPNFKPLKEDADSTRRADAKARIEAKLAELGA